MASVKIFSLCRHFYGWIAKRRFTTATLQVFCLKKMGWDESETNRTIVPVINEMKKGMRQTRLDGYFMRVEDNIKFADIKSKRLKEAWNVQEIVDDKETK